MKQFLTTGVQVQEKIETKDKEENQVYKILLTGQGYSMKTDVSEKVFNSYEVGDIAVMAYRPNATNQKLYGSDKTVKGFEPQFLGLQKIGPKDLKKYFELEELEISVMSKEHSPIITNRDKLESGEETEPKIYDYCTIGTSGLVSGIFKISMEDYESIQIHKSYKVNIRPEYEKGKLMLTLFNFVESGVVKELDGYDM